MKNLKIAITGGPSGGKTTLIETLKRELGQQVAVVPEAASILYKGGFPRIKSDSGFRHSQIAIYSTQRELEDLVMEHATAEQLVVCDRGSLDGLAYWPKISESFFSAIRSDRATELARYDWVLHLDTASSAHYEVNNPIRTETYQEAEVLNLQIKQAWDGHPRRIIIGANTDFLGKIQYSLKVIQDIQRGLI